MVRPRRVDRPSRRERRHALTLTGGNAPNRSRFWSGSWRAGGAEAQRGRARAAGLLMVFTTLVTSLIAPAAMANALPLPGPPDHGLSLDIRSGDAAGTHLTLTSKTIEVPASAVKSVNASGSSYTFSNIERVGRCGNRQGGPYRGPERHRRHQRQAQWHPGHGRGRPSLDRRCRRIRANKGERGARHGPSRWHLGCGRDRPDASARAGHHGRQTRWHALPTYSYKGSGSGFTYSLAFAGATNGIHVTGTICWGCATSLNINAKLDGTFTWANQDLDMGIAGGKATNGSFGISGMSSDLDLTYTVLRGAEPGAGGKPPVFKLPVAFEAPLCICAGIPIYSKFELAVLVTLGLGAKNSSVQGGAHVTISGSGSVSGTGVGGPGDRSTATSRGTS